MKKILLNICLALLLSTSVQANTSLVSVGAETPWGTTISYEHNINGNGLKGYFSTLSADITGTTIDSTSIGTSYTLYGKDTFKGFYAGPGIAYRTFDMTQLTTDLTTFTTTTIKAEATIIDIYLSAGYSLLIQDMVNLRLGLNIGYGFGDVKYTSGTTGISYDPEGFLAAITTSVGYAF